MAKINNFIFENANHNEISLYEAIRRIKIPTGSGTGTVTSVGLTMPSAFTVTGSPITTSGVFTVTGAGTSSQYIDGTGALQTFPSGTGLLTANNGLIVNPATNTQLGGQTLGTGNLIRNTYITNDGYEFRIDQINSSTNALYLNHSGTGLNAGTGLLSTTGGISVRASSSENFAFEGNSILDYTAALIRNSSSANDVVGLVKLVRNTSGTSASGIGGSIDFWIEERQTIPAPPPTDPTVRLAGIWENPGPAVLSRLSRFDIYGYSNGGQLINSSIRGDGAFYLYQYGLGTFAGTPTYSLGVDASGNVVEFVGGGGGGIKSGTASGTNNYTVTISGVSSYTDGDAYVIKFTNGNDDDSDININGLGVKNLVKEVNTRVTGGDIVSGQELIIIYDGTNFQTLGVAPNQLFAYVTNDDSVTINKGQPVYAYGSAGNRMSVKLASNLQDSTSAQTVGVVFSTSIAPNQRGFIITQGVISNVNTSAYTAGDQLYLGATAGTLTATKPYAPNHLVYIGIVERANAGNGQIYIKPQNGYELDELHDVDLITSAPVNNDLLTYVTGSPNLWKNRSLGSILGGTTSQYVRGDGTLATTPTGTVTGVTATSPITSSGGTAPVISTSMATNRLIGRSTAGTGVMEEIQVGNFLTLSGGVLSGVPPVETAQLYTNGWNIAPTIIGNTTGGGSTGSANAWYLVARYFGPNSAISQIGLRVDAFTTNVTLRLAIYDSTYDSTNCRFIPNNRIGNSGAISVTGLGFYSFTFPSILTVSGWVFFCMGTTGTGCSWRNVATASIIGLPAQITTGTPQGTSSSGKNGRYDNTTNSTSSDPPNPWSGTLTQNNANIPAIYFFVP